MKAFLLMILLALSISTIAQVAINSDGSNPDNSAMLDVKSTGKGMLIPRMTTIQRNAIASPAEGLLVYDADMGGFYYYHAGQWTSLTSAVQGWSLTGNAGTDPDVNFIGTTDNTALKFRINNQLSGVLDPINTNTGFGYLSLANNISGQANTATGNGALFFNETGSNNTASGRSALFGNTTGYGNTAIGSSALLLNTEGNRNTVSGMDALGQKTTGSSNTAIGDQAGYYLIGGNGNIFIGSSSGPNFDQIMDSTLWIGRTKGNKPAIYGDLKEGRIGIGSTDPRSAFNVTNGGLAIGSGDGISATHGARCSLQILTDTYYGGVYNNHSGFLIYSTMPAGWGNATLNFAVSTSWGIYNTSNPTLTLSGSSVGIGTTTPNSSALVDMASTTKGFLPPRMTQAQRTAITTPAAGLLVYQTDNTAGYYYYNGANWVSMEGAGAGSDSTSTCIDYDGNAYPTFQIGTQVWMAENLRVTHYRNGDAIPNVTDNGAWTALTTGAYCWYDNDQVKNAKYGALYNWYAVNDSRGLCPAGWHEPTDAEWTTLTTYLGGLTVAGGKIKSVSALWSSPNTDATNSSGFSGLPGGYRGRYGSGFEGVGDLGGWWTSTEEINFFDALFRRLVYNNWLVYRSGISKDYGFSVRCMRDY